MIDQLSDALFELRETLRRGELHSLDRLSQEIEALLDQLEQEGAMPQQLTQLRETAADMEHILQAAHKGLLTARRRLSEIEEVRAGLTTYSAEGVRLVEPHAQGPTHRL